MQFRPPVVLAVGGSDPTAGAGIQVDLRVAQAHGVHATTVVTAVTAQGSCGVSAVHNVPATLVRAQLRAVLDEFPPGAIKTGMLARTRTVEAVAAGLAASRAPLVVDPVLAASYGTPLLALGALDAVRTLLIPRATVLTPNLTEAARLLGETSLAPEDLDEACRELLAIGPRAVLLKGGHAPGDEVIDRFAVAERREVLHLRAPRRPGRGIHGTGCALASAIAARLALGVSLDDAVRGAHGWLQETLERTRVAGLGRKADILAELPSLCRG